MLVRQLERILLTYPAKNKLIYGWFIVLQLTNQPKPAKHLGLSSACFKVDTHTLTQKPVQHVYMS